MTDGVSTVVSSPQKGSYLAPPVSQVAELKSRADAGADCIAMGCLARRNETKYWCLLLSAATVRVTNNSIAEKLFARVLVAAVQFYFPT